MKFLKEILSIKLLPHRQHASLSMQNTAVLLGLCPESPEYSFISKSVSSFSKCMFREQIFELQKEKNKIVVAALFILSCERR
jgi:hypothetical protein